MKNDLTVTAYEAFLEHLIAVKNYSPQTVRAYRNDLKLIAEHLREHGINKLRQVNHRVVAELVGWMRSKPNGRTDEAGLADASIARRLAALSTFLDYVQATVDSSQLNPIKTLPHRWKKNKEPKPVDDMTIDLLLSSIDIPRDKTLFYLLLASGLRVSEVHQLNRDSIAFESEVDDNGEVHWIGSGEVVGKGRKTRKFYIAGYALVLLAEYLTSRTDKDPALFLSERKSRMSVRAIQYTLDAWCKKLGFSHINVHRLRHTYATRLANANIDAMHLKALMGHSSFNTTQQYFKLTDKTLARGYFAAMEFVSR
jgi:site-specific recombinase XerD